jgi:hypothetical protein
MVADRFCSYFLNLAFLSCFKRPHKAHTWTQHNYLQIYEISTQNIVNYANNQKPVEVLWHHERESYWKLKRAEFIERFKLAFEMLF